LIDGPPLTANGKRPRFRLIGSQVDTFQRLREIDRLCAGLYGDDAPSWLARPNDAPVFGGRSPLSHMVQHRNGVADTLHQLGQQALRAASRNT
jgi:hypothetical protein